LPSINQLYQAFNERDFAVLAIDIREAKGVVEKAVQERDYAFSVLLDNTGEVALLYEVRATPTVYLIDRQGKLVASAVGARPWDSQEGRQLLQALLTGK
jgi:thioredoxin-related protein